MIANASNIEVFKFEANDYFVFGSNTAGIHGAGSAQWARRFYGAKYGVGEGICGSSYALPSVLAKGTRLDKMSWDEFIEHCNRFIDFARDNSAKRFWLTKVGCGLARFDEKSVSSFFLKADLPPNILLPGVWLAKKETNLIRAVVAGSRKYVDKVRVFQSLDSYFQNNPGNIAIVSGDATGPDKFGKQYGLERNIPVKLFPAQWNVYGNLAGFVRNNLMAIYGTVLFAYHMNNSSGTADMIKTSKREGLSVGEIMSI